MIESDTNSLTKKKARYQYSRQIQSDEAGLGTVRGLANVRVDTSTLIFTLLYGTVGVLKPRSPHTLTSNVVKFLVSANPQHTVSWRVRHGVYDERSK